MKSTSINTVLWISYINYRVVQIFQVGFHPCLYCFVFVAWQDQMPVLVAYSR